MNRDRQNRWDANHLTTITTKMPAIEVERLDRLISAEGYQSRYAFLLHLIEQWDAEYTKRDLQHKAQDADAPDYVRAQAQRVRRHKVLGNFDTIEHNI